MACRPSPPTLLLLLLCCVSQQLVLSSPFPSSSGWDWIATLDGLDGLAFRQIASPLVQITANAYRYPKEVAVEGWTVASGILPLAPLHGGAHAVVYEETSSSSSAAAAATAGHGKRLVVAFRGTDLSGDEDSIADMCADWILFGDNDRVLPNPKVCSTFSNETLDYFSQALNFTTKVMQAYPDAPLLLTGHSLGATLALLVSAALSEHCILPVVAFSAGGAKNILEKYSMRLEADEKHMAFVISDEWDEVMRTSWKKQVGIFCYYKTTIPLSCEICFQMKPSYHWQTDHGVKFVKPRRALDAFKSWVSHEHAPSHLQNAITETKFLEFSEGMMSISRFVMPTTENVACSDCFFRTHYLKHVMGLVAAGTRPVCLHFESLPTVDERKNNTAKDHT